MTTQVIVLNGGSSSGKSGIARCLQAILPQPWIRLGVDDLLEALPPSLTDSGAGIAFGQHGEVVAGEGFRETEAAWMTGVAAMAQAGARIIVDDVFLGGGASQERTRAFLPGLEVLWAGVRCDPGIAAGREIARGDRVKGMAASQAEMVHKGVVYDIEVDTSHAEPAPKDDLQPLQKIDVHRTMTGQDVSAGYVRRACEESLRRLGTGRIDLYQLHLGALPISRAQEVAGTLEDLVTDGLIRSYGWSTDDPERAASLASGPHFAAVQHELNVLADAPAMLDICAACDIASINRGPLAMGLLTGKYDAGSRLAAGDVRGPGGPSWMEYFTNGRPAPESLARLGVIREVLTSGGRTLAQGALGWLLARSPRTVPIPGIRTVAQAEQNAAALRLGPLPATAMAEITRLLGQEASS